jgi:hypothetical protein
VTPGKQRTGELRIQQAFVEEQRNHPVAPDFRKRLVSAYGEVIGGFIASVSHSYPATPIRFLRRP